MQSVEYRKSDVYQRHLNDRYIAYCIYHALDRQHLRMMMYGVMDDGKMLKTPQNQLVMTYLRLRGYVDYTNNGNSQYYHCQLNQAGIMFLKNTRWKKKGILK